MLTSTKHLSHPFANLFPLLEGEDLQRLADDIRENGLHHPIVLYQEKILDGRNRYRACEIAGVELDARDFSEFNGTDDEALALVISLNVTRRHLTTVVRATVAAQLFDHEKVKAAERRKAGVRLNLAEGGKAVEVAGSRVGVAAENVRLAVKVRRKAPDVFDAMAAGQIRSMPEAVKLSRLPDGQRTEILDMVIKEEMRADQALQAYRKRLATSELKIRKNKPRRVEHPAYKLVYGQHVMDSLKELSDKSVHVVCTSPPYWGLRDFGTEPVIWGGNPDCPHDWEYLETNKQGAPENARRQENNATCRLCGAWSGHLGQEYSPDIYVQHLVDVFREIRRVLRDDGTVWLNLGDCYSTTIVRSRKEIGEYSASMENLREYNLMGMPWRVALALQADGWYLRSDVVWHRNNIQPESILDRPTHSHEYVFLLSKAPGYYYDQYAILEPWVDSDKTRKALSRNGKAALVGRYRRSVWTINTRAKSGNHFAVFPPELPELAIKASTSDFGVCPHCGTPWKRVVERKGTRPRAGEGLNVDFRSGGLLHEQAIRLTGVSSNEFDQWLKENPPLMKGWTPNCECPDNNGSGRSVVLDPFSGSGTTGRGALELRRNYIGFDLNANYLKDAEKRIKGWHKEPRSGGRKPKRRS